jgi:hypothetical protein
MRQPWSMGFKSPTNRHPGRRHIGACNKKAGARGSVIHRKPNAGSRSVSRGREAVVRRPLLSTISSLDALIPCVRRDDIFSLAGRSSRRR